MATRSDFSTTMPRKINVEKTTRDFCEMLVKHTYIPKLGRPNSFEFMEVMRYSTLTPLELLGASCMMEEPGPTFLK